MKINDRSTISILFMSCSLNSAQEQYISPEDVKVEWKDHTSFQRQELVNFATFLYNEGFYERALLSYFQYLYRYPKDKLEMAAYFQIGKCYENMRNWDLAKNYYNRIIDASLSGSVNAKAAQYQLHYIALANEDYIAVLDSTEETKDPYELVFRAYAHFETLEWTEAQQAFKAAEALFDYDHYSKQIQPFYSSFFRSSSNGIPNEFRMALAASSIPILVFSILPSITRRPSHILSVLDHPISRRPFNFSFHSFG